VGHKKLLGKTASKDLTLSSLERKNQKLGFWIFLKGSLEEFMNWW
jgi:hypothetical protein